MNQKIALGISRIAHPLLLLSLFVFYSTFSILDVETAVWTALTIIAIAVIPLIGWNSWKTHRGAYSNFDVSIREQRFSMFGFIFLLSCLLIGFLYLSGQPSALLVGTLLLIEGLLLVFFLNFWIKASLHITVAAYICFGLLPLNPHFAAALAAMIPLIGWARVTQKRHTVPEVVWGLGIGVFTGIQLLYWTGYFTQVT
nr:hypothetical protein [Cytophagales bacterium]